MREIKANPVQGLRRLLRDDYGADAIVRELLQNADDAKGGQFHVAWSDGWSDGLHPLLTGPILLVLNDGKFDNADNEAICNLDVGAKGGDVAAIGKYGLGTIPGG